MEIGVRYLPLVFVFLVIVLVVLTLCDLFVNGTENLSDYLFSTREAIQRNAASDSLILSVQGCLLRQILNLMWIIVSFLIYIKHRQVNDILNRYDMSHRKALNRRALEAGLVAALGCSIIANFQEAELFYMHWIGKVLLFGCGGIYQCIQTLQYWRLCNIIGQRKTTIFRAILSAISVISFITFFTCAVVTNIEEKNDTLISRTGVTLRWVCAASTMVYLILFQEEFRKITLYEPDVFVEDKMTTSIDTQYTNEAFENK